MGSRSGPAWSLGFGATAGTRRRARARTSPAACSHRIRGPGCRSTCGCGPCWCTRTGGSGNRACQCRSATIRPRRRRWASRRGSRPSWGGQAMSGADALWGRDAMTGLGEAGPGSGHRLDGELGYALPVGRRLVGTPRFGVTTSEYGRDYRLGYSLGMLQGGAMKFQFSLDAQRRESLLGQGNPGPQPDGAESPRPGRGGRPRPCSDALGVEAIGTHSRESVVVGPVRRGFRSLQAWCAQQMARRHHIDQGIPGVAEQPPMIEKVWRELHELMKDIDAADCEDATHGRLPRPHGPIGPTSGRKSLVPGRDCPEVGALVAAMAIPHATGSTGPRRGTWVRFDRAVQHRPPDRDEELMSMSCTAV